MGCCLDGQPVNPRLSSESGFFAREQRYLATYVHHLHMLPILINETVIALRGCSKLPCGCWEAQAAAAPSSFKRLAALRFEGCKRYRRSCLHQETMQAVKKDAVLHLQCFEVDVHGDDGCSWACRHACLDGRNRAPYCLLCASICSSLLLRPVPKGWRSP